MFKEKSMHNIHYEYLKPSWKNCHTCHDWKNYVTGDLQKEWDNFTDKQKIVIGQSLQEIADREEWD
ncbi:hypothetical protein TUST1-10_00170 [Vibrio phage ICP1_2004_A]|jgi:hypothetical protein|nr:hypothetical protein TUST1-191_00175 [Vibrio phage ICP1_2006_D]ADX88308.1 hypothetical protein TUST1-182_00175 [Vibrio phage ICP1_2006_C]ADX88535.1 hypothetical protein TUST1-159_00175 [Vibrio phage ICP1_2006_B]ADX88761.1 hypothetical protein TUST1-17_00175 [Vibrio phage ICP1_2006_A]ADX88987.1 hypothetical protein TUST1-15_00175 [Vibrio phage ICP1_2005_A]ADX89219.1 hypothetical protein TUST1-2_00185 [Vibrio phage ICP1_2001_A]ADX89446.1 hypothetical protein TUST1-10_00170 [Vibrio phage ICP1